MLIKNVTSVFRSNACVQILYVIKFCSAKEEEIEVLKTDPDDTVSKAARKPILESEFEKLEEGTKADAKTALLALKDLTENIPIVEDKGPNYRDESEKEAISALLQMHLVEPPKPVVQEEPKEEPKPVPRVAQMAEHNYFAFKTPPHETASLAESDKTDSASEAEEGELQKPCVPLHIYMDHSYCQLYVPFERQKAEGVTHEPLKIVNRTVNDNEYQSILDSLTSVSNNQVSTVPEVKNETEIVDTSKKKTPVRGRKEKKLKDITNRTPKGSRELASLLPPPKPKIVWNKRTPHEEGQVHWDFILKGLDYEDAAYIKRRYVTSL